MGVSAGQVLAGVPGRVVVAATPLEAAREAAARLSAALREVLRHGGEGTIALSGGNTPRDAYATLGREDGIAWNRVRCFWVDERAVGPEDDRSNYRWARAELLDKVPLPGDRIHRMHAERPDGEAAAADYEHAIRANVGPDAEGVPSLDVVVLGIGDDGHTASLFPGDSSVDVVDRLVVAVPAKGAREARLTLTPPMIHHAKHVFVLVVGAGKRVALERVWAAQGDVHETPARVARACRGSLTWIVDEAVSGRTG